ncbi:MAG: response regulator [Candidatus Omnitrophica bacterium]|nr:response regulator [Candidatus Omnitrophota bacterium]
MQTSESQLKQNCVKQENKKQVYIVDDDQSVNRALKFLMVSHGFAVDTFSSSEEFFSAIPNSAPGCLILDIHMQGLSGWQAYRKLKQTGCSRPVIMITADRNGGLKERALEAGVVGLLQKPFRDQELVDLIKNEC